jgi:hypothetical protein
LRFCLVKPWRESVEDNRMEAAAVAVVAAAMGLRVRSSGCSSSYCG